MRGEGFPLPGRRGKGDHVVQVIVQTPTKISAKQEKLLRELDAIDRGGGKMKKSATRKFFSLLESFARVLRGPCPGGGVR